MLLSADSFGSGAIVGSSWIVADSSAFGGTETSGFAGAGFPVALSAATPLTGAPAFDSAPAFSVMNSDAMMQPSSTSNAQREGIIRLCRSSNLLIATSSLRVARHAEAECLARLRRGITPRETQFTHGARLPV